jgi:hypothetical protein
LLELTFVRILVTIRAVRKCNASVTWLAIWSRSVTTGALHVAMFTGKRETRRGVIEVLAIDSCCLPVSGRVAFCAIRSQATLVMVHMARDAIWHQTEPCAVEILAAEQRASLRGNMLRAVAGTTTHAYMLAVEQVARFHMVESFRRGIPVQHLEIDSIVVRVTLHTCCARRAGRWEAGMKSLVLLKLAPDLAVTIHAPERPAAGRNLMALDAIRCPVQALMRTCKRARRNLGLCAPRT